MEIFPSVLKLFKNKGVFLVNYNLDHPFNFVSKASGNKNILLNNPIYHLHLTYSKQIQKELMHKFPKIKVEYLPFGYHSYVDEIKLNGESLNTTCFIGQADDERAELVSYISSNDIEVHLYGNGWDKYFKNNPKVRVHAAVSGKEYWYTLNKYRIQLNLLRRHNYESHNMRTFEIPAAESIMVSNRTEEQCIFFTDKKEAFYFESRKELVNILRNLIKLSAKESIKIRKLAKKKSFENSYKNRAKRFYTIINKEYESFYTDITTFHHPKRNGLCE
jgi:spore maturation protein CgeB